MKRVFVIILTGIVVIALVLLGLVWWNFMAKRAPMAPQGVPPAQSPPTEDIPQSMSLAQGLEIPWALAFMQDGNIIFTERPGRVRLFDLQEGLLPQPLLTISEVAHRGEGGLLGLALHPDFARNGFVYVYYTYQAGSALANRVVRFTMAGRSLRDETVILDGIPGAGIHDGGRLKFGPDGKLYITTGDASNSALSQDINSLAGKILRLNDNGTIPSDNPFPGSPVYSYGHRNPQGLTWDRQGRLWETEHGSSARDELNLITPGSNYGWPVIRGDETAPRMESPVLHSGNDTWAPSGLAYYDGSLFFAGLRGQSLYRVTFDGQQVSLQRHLEGKFGRLREVVLGPDDLLYVFTNNRDGRGVPAAEDDQLIRINPGKL